MQAEELVRGCYGVEVRLVDAAGLGLCRRLRAELPPEFGVAVPAAPDTVAIAYAVAVAGAPAPGAAPEYLVTCDGVEVFAAAGAEEV